MVRSVLLVEDQPDIRHVIELALARDKRFEVVSCSCGREAVQRAAEGRRPFDCVLLDYMLPDMSNVDCVRGLRVGRATRGAKLILITAYVPPGGPEAYLTAGMDAVILKPFDVLSLGDQVAGILTGDGGSLAVRDRSWRSARRQA